MLFLQIHLIKLFYFNTGKYREKVYVTELQIYS